MSQLRAAAEAIADGELVVYPTETVYGLAADALDPAAIDRVFAAKGRDRDNPLSMGVPDVATAVEYTEPTERETAFMREFLPGPVTVLVASGPEIPDALTGGREQVGIRVADNEVARDLPAAAGPVTATSANVSGNESVRTVGDLDPPIREAATVVLDGGETGGTESSVVDVGADEIIREGAAASAIRAWLDRN
jgi:L-threonylcarbamoyladenylate synthase